MPKKSNYERIVEPYFELIKAWKRDDISDEEIAARLNICPATFYNYRNKYPEFKEILSKNRELTDAEVENVALDNAKGFIYEEEQVATETEIYYDEFGKKTKEITHPVVVTVKKKKLSNPASAQWWLKNRMPAKWKDKQEIDVGNTDGRPFKLEDVI